MIQSPFCQLPINILTCYLNLRSYVFHLFNLSLSLSTTIWPDSDNDSLIASILFTRVKFTCASARKNYSTMDWNDTLRKQSTTTTLSARLKRTYFLPRDSNKMPLKSSLTNFAIVFLQTWNISISSHKCQVRHARPKRICRWKDKLLWMESNTARSLAKFGYRDALIMRNNVKNRI